MELIRLNNGLEIEVIGSGTNTFGKEDRNYMGTITNDTTELASAIAQVLNEVYGKTVLPIGEVK